MGPPPKNTKKYQVYLKKQAKRRKDERKQKRTAKFEAQVKEHVAKVKEEHANEVAKLMRRSNDHFRARGKAEMESQMAQREVARLRADLRNAKERAAMFEDWWKKEESIRKTTEDERNKALRTLSRWDIWWRDLNEKAPKKVKKDIAYYARPRPAPADRCWGGGQ